MAGYVYPRAMSEALLVAHVLLDPELLAYVDLTRLSGGCRTLLGLVESEEFVVRGAGLVAASEWTGDPYAVRLAERVVRLPLGDLAEWTRETVVGLANSLPPLSPSLGAGSPRARGRRAAA